MQIRWVSAVLVLVLDQNSIGDKTHSVSYGKRFYSQTLLSVLTMSLELHQIFKNIFIKSNSLCLVKKIMKVSILVWPFQWCLKILSVVVRENIFKKKARAEYCMDPVCRSVYEQTHKARQEPTCHLQICPKCWNKSKMSVGNVPSSENQRMVSLHHPADLLCCWYIC